MRTNEYLFSSDEDFFRSQAFDLFSFEDVLDNSILVFPHDLAQEKDLPLLYDLAYYHKLCSALKQPVVFHSFLYQQRVFESYLDAAAKSPSYLAGEDGHFLCRVDFPSLYQFLLDHYDVWQFFRWYHVWCIFPGDSWGEEVMDHFVWSELPLDWEMWLYLYSRILRPWLFRLKADMVPIEPGVDGRVNTGEFLEVDEIVADIFPQTFFDIHCDLDLDTDEDWFLDDFWNRLKGGFDADDVDADDLLWVWVRIFNKDVWEQTPPMFSRHFFRTLYYWVNPWYWWRAPKQSMLRRRFFRQKNRHLYRSYFLSWFDLKNFLQFLYILHKGFYKYRVSCRFHLFSVVVRISNWHEFFQVPRKQVGTHWKFSVFSFLLAIVLFFFFWWITSYFNELYYRFFWRLLLGFWLFFLVFVVALGHRFAIYLITFVILLFVIGYFFGNVAGIFPFEENSYVSETISLMWMLKGRKSYSSYTNLDLLARVRGVLGGFCRYPICWMGGPLTTGSDNLIHYLYPSGLDPVTYTVWYVDLVRCLDGGDYFSLIEYIYFLIFVCSLMLVLVLFVTPRENRQAKVLAYECGFDPVGDARMLVDIHYYLIGILFLIFDLEIIFLFPWLFSFVPTSSFFFFNFGTGLLFLLTLGLGFIFEWQTGALDWALRPIKRPIVVLGPGKV